MLCPRCGAKNSTTHAYYEPTCMLCGWVDYTEAPPKSDTNDPHRPNRGYDVKYTGGKPALRSLKVQVSLLPGRSGAYPLCPWDKGRMLGRGREATENPDLYSRETWYACESGHRILLKRDYQGEAVGWV